MFQDASQYLSLFPAQLLSIFVIRTTGKVISVEALLMHLIIFAFYLLHILEVYHTLLEVKLPALLGNYDRKTNQPTD